MTDRPLYKPLTDQERAEIRAAFEQKVRKIAAVEAHYVIARRPMKNGLRMQYATCPNCGTAFHWPRTGEYNRRNIDKAFAHIADCTGRYPAATTVKCEAEEGPEPQAVATPLILKRAPIGDNQDNYDVLENGKVVGRIFKAQLAPQGRPWMWASGHGGHIERAVHGYAETREAAMAAFAKSWRGSRLARPT
jgi:hypothetical protein